MKIAFTSCMNIQVYPRQPLWGRIAAQSPQHLVLTGDSIYLDVPVGGGMHPKQMTDNQFMTLGHGLYRAQLQEPGFNALVRQVPTYAIWDDHDFLWNEAYREKAITRTNLYAGTIRATRALFRSFCEALQARDPDQFPTDTSAGSLWRPVEDPPGYRFVDLGGNVALHLTDGRSWRLKRELLGADQRQRIAAQMAALPADTVHLLASGSVLQRAHGEQWASFNDFEWLKGLARQYKILALSGDIHDNDLTSIEVGPGRYLFDATASGAAVNKLVELGPPRQNHGLLDIDAATVQVVLYAAGVPDNRTPRRLDRQRWCWLP